MGSTTPHATLAVFLLLASSCASSSSSPAGESAAPQPGASPSLTPGTHEAARAAELRWSGYFWDVPDPLPSGEPGDLIRVGLREGGSGVRVYRTMYHSTSVDGATPVAVTGTLWVPGGAPPAGGFPIMAWGPGFSGVGDDCALSRHPDRDYQSLLHRFVADGFVVASTDYEGHGTRYPYLDTIGASGTHALIDGARAAQDLLGPAASDRIVIAGHSLGGDMASASQIFAPDYADGLDIRGVVSIEPVGDYERLAAGDPNPEGVGVFLLMRAVRAMTAAYPELRAGDVLTPRGLELLQTVHEDGCQPFPDLDVVPQPDAQKVDLMSVDSWAERFRSQTVTDAPYPVFYIMAENGNGLADSVRLTAERLCGTADHVLFKVYPGDHDNVVAIAYGDYVPWLVDRVTTDAAVDGCAF
jgi:Secretory lipase